MRILYITLENLSLQKGSVTHIREIVDGLRSHGHDVGLAGCSWNETEKDQEFYNLLHPVVSRFKWLVRKRTPYLLSSGILFLYLLKVLPRYDIIYARDYHTVLIALLPRLLFGKKLIFEMNGLASEEYRLRGKSIRNSIAAYLIQKAEKMATKYSDRIVVVTPQIASYLRTHFRCQTEKMEVVSNGVNTRKFSPVDNAELLAEWRRRLGIGNDEMVVAFVGNLAPWQGVESLIRVAPVILSEMRNVRFLIVGDGMLKKRLEAEVARLGIVDHFIFTGMIDYKEIPFYINISDVCVLLKRELASGYSPIKVYEYMACGKPVIASRVAGLEFIETEGVGRLVEPGDIISIEKGLSELLRDPQKRIHMGGRGLQLVRERFDWESRVVKIGIILEGLA